MLLTTEQIREILDIIRNKHASFVYKYVTRDIDPRQLAELKNKGYIRDAEEVRQYFKDAYEIERLKELVTDERFKNMDYNEFRKHLFENPIPVTDTEAFSIDHINSSAGQYITKQSDLLQHKAEELIRNKNVSLKNDIITQTIRKPLKVAVEERKTISELVSDLRRGSDDIWRDWHRVANTEMQNARNHANVDSIVKRNEGVEDTEILVFKRPSPDACKVCKSVYLEDDGITPKVFTLSEMKKHITNFGVKGGAKKWQPTIETVHPHCRCQLGQLPAGYGFKEDGTITFKGPKYQHKAKKPQPAEVNWNLYDSDGNLKKSKMLSKIRKFKHSDELRKSLQQTGKKSFTLAEVIEHIKEIKHCKCKK